MKAVTNAVIKAVIKTMIDAVKMQQGFRHKAQVVLVTLLLSWIVGGTLHGLLGDTTPDITPAFPDMLVAEVAESLPQSRYYLVFDSGSCGVPFHVTVNYLNNRNLGADVAVLTSDNSTKRLRGIGAKSGTNIYGGRDELVRKVLGYADALLIERTEAGKLVAYTFNRPSMTEYVAILDDVLGAASQRFGERREYVSTEYEVVPLVESGILDPGQRLSNDYRLVAQ